MASRACLIWRATSRSVRSSNANPPGFFHIDIAEVQTTEGKLYLFVGIDRTSKFAATQFVDKADRKTAWEFLQHMLEAVPYQVHTILTDRAIGTPLVRVTMARGIQFAEQPRNRNTVYSRPMHFDMICEANGIEHRLTKPNHPWTNGQVERMNRTIKEGEADQKTIRGIVFPLNVKRFHYETHDRLRTHLADFILRRGRQSAGLSSDPSSPTTSRAGSRPPVASPLTNTSARSGHQSPTDSS